MKMLQAAAMGLALSAFVSGSALAQTMSNKDPTAKPMAMSEKDKKMMASCKAMSKDMMMKDKGCMKMMKAHPEMKDDGMMKSDGMMKKN